MDQNPKRAEHLTGEARAAAVRDIFTRIAPRYDLMNRLMTLGLDQQWRRYAIRKASLPPGGTLLDIATGTGDLAVEAILQVAGVTAIGADFVPAIMQAGRSRTYGHRVRWLNADALNLPFPDQCFDAVTHGFLLRNVIDIPRALAEQWRVLKPGGRVVCLDTTPPPPNALRPLLNVYLTRVIPVMGALITGQADAYAYLPNSTLNFKTPAILSAQMREAGFADIGFRRFMFNTIAVHWGTKPKPQPGHA